jgi:hypothetical protein
LIIHRFLSLLGLFCLAAAITYSASSLSPVPPPSTATDLAFYPAEVISTLSPVSAGLISFANSLINASPQLVGIYVEGLFAFRIVQQPEDNPVYVASVSDVVTQFRATERYHSVGLLAHNTLAGANFFALEKGQQIILIDGFGNLSYYQVEQFQRYQAISPSDASSKFIDSSNYKTMTAGELFRAIYEKSNWLVLQTCISSPENTSWGRFFVLARRINQTESIKFNN